MIQRTEPHNKLGDLPPEINLESPVLLKLSIKANRLLAELKGYCQTLPDPKILINTVVLQESKASSAIENIVTTQDELYRAVASFDDGPNVPSTVKEVLLYREALYTGLELMKKRGLTTNTMIRVMQQLKNTTEEVRKMPGTKLSNPASGETIYTPPQGEILIREKLFALEKFINNEKDEIDPLIKMALIHYQFEAIYPFSDGNGRTGRILNVLYLVQEELLTLPVLYLSSFIIKNKNEYYKLLREVTEKGNWNGWILYMLSAVAETAHETLQKIRNIQRLKEETIPVIKGVLKTSYSRDIVDLIFTHPYLKIKTLEMAGIAKRVTASAYLNKLVSVHILKPVKSGKEIYFINDKLMNVISK